MMKNITMEEAKNLLLVHEAENASNLENIDFMTRNHVECEYLTVGGAVVIRQVFRGENFTNVCPLDGDCDVEEIAAYLTENCRGTNVQVDVQKLSAEAKAVLMKRMGEAFTCRKTYTDAVYRGDAAFAEDPAVRLLTEGDRDAYLAMEYVQPQYRPPLALLFDSYVIRGDDGGKILAFFDGDTVVGSLSYVHSSGKYYDVDYIWVAPSRRREGIGGRLTAAYLREVTACGGIPMWSNPKTEASERLSGKFGFVPNRETVSFE